MISDEQLKKGLMAFVFCCEVKVGPAQAGWMYDALQELKQRRESDLRPAAKFLGLTKSQQHKRVIEEVTEFSEALDLLNQFPSDPKPIGYDSARIFVLEELVDVQTACETMMAILGADEADRNEVRRMVIEKNRRRGYYEGAAEK